MTSTTAGASSWQELAAAKRAKLAASLPAHTHLRPSTLDALSPTASVLDVARSSGLLDPVQLALTNEVNPSVLLTKLASGEVSASEVCEAFCARASIAQQLVGCLTESLFDRAATRAKELDDSFKQTGELVGPLHGLPVSVKEQFDIEGVESTMGFVSRIGHISAHTSTLVHLLESVGALIHCRTNVPQTLLSDESVNNVFGRTSNPHNLSLTAGGSSGGEAALLAMKGSIVGFGTDLGGSIRKPASFCGLYSLRPTSRRLPYAGASNVFEGAESLESVVGPMANSLEALEVVMGAVVGAKPWEFDPKCVERPFLPFPASLEQVGAEGKKSFGLMRWDGLVRPHPPIERALEETIASLRAAGHEVIEWDALDHAGAQEIVSRIFDADGGEDVRRWVGESGEPLCAQVFSSQHPAMSMWESWQLNKRRDAYRTLFLETYLATQARTSTGRPIDAILCPTAPHLAEKHLDHPRPGGLITYTTVWSLLDVPCYTFPVTTVDPARDSKPETGSYEGVSEVDRANWDGYSPERYEGAPVCLQLVNPRRFREDELLGLGRLIERALGRE